MVPLYTLSPTRAAIIRIVQDATGLTPVWVDDEGEIVEVTTVEAMVRRAIKDVARMVVRRWVEYDLVPSVVRMQRTWFRAFERRTEASPVVVPRRAAKRQHRRQSFVDVVQRRKWKRRRRLQITCTFTL